MKTGHLEAWVSPVSNVLCGENGLFFFISARRLWSTAAFILPAYIWCFEKSLSSLLQDNRIDLLQLTSRHCRNMNIKFTIYVLSNVSVPAIQPAFYTQLSESSLFCSCLCQSSCSLYVSARPEALCCSSPPHNVWLCSSRLFQATWRQSCRTRKVLNTTRARLTLLPLTVRWK